MNLVSHIFFLFLSNFSELRIDHYLDYTSTSRPPNFLHHSWLLLHLPRDLLSLLGNKVKTQKYLKNKRHQFLYQEVMPSSCVLLKLKLCCISRALWLGCLRGTFLAAMTKCLAEATQRSKSLFQLGL